MKKFFAKRKMYNINGFLSDWDLDKETKEIAYNKDKHIGIACWQSKRDPERREYYFIIDVKDRQNAVNALKEGNFKISKNDEVFLSFSMREFANCLKKDQECVNLFNELQDLDVSVDEMLKELGRELPIVGVRNKSTNPVYSWKQNQFYSLSEAEQAALKKGHTIVIGIDKSPLQALKGKIDKFIVSQKGLKESIKSIEEKKKLDDSVDSNISFDVSKPNINLNYIKPTIPNRYDKTSDQNERMDFSMDFDDEESNSNVPDDVDMSKVKTIKKISNKSKQDINDQHKKKKGKGC